MDKRLGNIPLRRVYRPEETDSGSSYFYKGKKDKNRKALAVLAVGLCLLLLIFLPNTYSSFRADTLNQGSSFTAAGIEDYLKLTPGTSVANGGSGLVTKVANGQLACDFGVISRGAAVSYDNVMLFNNLTDKPLSVTWQVQGGIVALVQSGAVKFTLEPTQSVTSAVYQTVYGSEDPLVKSNPYSFGISLNAAESGTYEGFLEIKVNGEFLVRKVPMVVVVE